MKITHREFPFINIWGNKFLVDDGDYDTVVVSPNGATTYLRNGIPHRLNYRPAVISNEGEQYWVNGVQIQTPWYQCGKFYRQYGPAVEYPPKV